MTWELNIPLCNWDHNFLNSGPQVAQTGSCASGLTYANLHLYPQIHRRHIGGRLDHHQQWTGLPELGRQPGTGLHVKDPDPECQQNKGSGGGL